MTKQPMTPLRQRMIEDMTIRNISEEAAFNKTASCSMKAKSQRRCNLR
jgi:hypothetical protein